MLKEIKDYQKPEVIGILSDCCINDDGGPAIACGHGRA